jgi:hypothetical protein
VALKLEAGGASDMDPFNKLGGVMLQQTHSHDNLKSNIIKFTLKIVINLL